MMKITLHRTLKIDGQLYSRHVEYRTLRKGDVYLSGGFEDDLVCTSTADLDGENQPFWPILKPIEEKETFSLYTRLPALGTLNGTFIKLDRPRNGEEYFVRETMVKWVGVSHFIYPIIVK